MHVGWLDKYKCIWFVWGVLVALRCDETVGTVAAHRQLAGLQHHVDIRKSVHHAVMVTTKAVRMLTARPGSRRNGARVMLRLVTTGVTRHTFGCCCLQSCSG
jgi:hypothetical protein